MSNLNPGGSRKTTGRVFSPTGIRAAIQKGLKARDHAKEAERSIADKPHTNSREAQRRLRQEARRNGKRA